MGVLRRPKDILRGLLLSFSLPIGKPSDKTLRDAFRDRCFHVVGLMVSTGEAELSGIGASGARGIMATGSGIGVRKLEEAGELDCADSGSTATTRLGAVVEEGI